MAFDELNDDAEPSSAICNMFVDIESRGVPPVILVYYIMSTSSGKYTLHEMNIFLKAIFFFQRATYSRPKTKRSSCYMYFDLSDALI